MRIQFITTLRPFSNTVQLLSFSCLQIWSLQLLLNLKNQSDSNRYVLIPYFSSRSDQLIVVSFMFSSSIAP